MKVLSLWQPWASLMACGAKTIETRGWRTSYRGPLIIHAAKHFDRDQWAFLHTDEVQRALWASSPEPPRDWTREDLPFGCALGVVELTDCVSMSGAFSPRVVPELFMRVALEESLGDYSPKRWLWLTANLRRFARPVPMIGHQWLFSAPDSPALREALAEVGSRSFNEEVMHNPGGKRWE